MNRSTGSMARAIQRCLLGICLLWAAQGHSQEPFPSPGLLNATNQQTALAILGATKPELSGHLLLDAPDITIPGAFDVQAKSLLPGTSVMVLLRVSKVPPSSPGKPEKPYVAGARIAPGKLARLNASIDALSHLNLILLAQSRGKWFYVTREVKVGRPGSAP